MTHEEFLEAWGKKPIYNKDGEEVEVDEYCRSSGNAWDQNARFLGKINGLTTEKPAPKPNVVKLTDMYELHLFENGKFKFAYAGRSDGKTTYICDPQCAYDATHEPLDGNLRQCIDALVKLVRENC